MQKEKTRFYKTKWFLWIWLIFFPPIGLILLWTCHNEMKKKSRIILSAVFAIWGIILFAATQGGPAKQNIPQSHIYDNAQVKDVMNGSRTDKIGEYSIIEVKSEDVTEEALTDWYFNYVSKNNYNWCMILYTDKNDDTGVYAIKGMVQKDVKFTEDKHGDYALSEADATANSITYGPTDDGKLKKLP